MLLNASVRITHSCARVHTHTHIYTHIQTHTQVPQRRRHLEIGGKRREAPTQSCQGRRNGGGSSNKGAMNITRASLLFFMFGPSDLCCMVLLPRGERENPPFTQPHKLTRERAHMRTHTHTHTPTHTHTQTPHTTYIQIRT